MSEQKSIAEQFVDFLRTLRVTDVPTFEWAKPKELPRGLNHRYVTLEWRVDHFQFRVYLMDEGQEPEAIRTDKLWGQRKKFMDSYFGDVPKGSAACAAMANGICTPLYEKFGLIPRTVQVEGNQRILVIRTSFAEMDGRKFSVSFAGHVKY